MNLMKKGNEKNNKKWRLRRIFKNRMFIFVMTALVFSTIGVSAATYFPSNQVTYDNKTSGLSSTNVQGAIDELYGACANPPAAADDLIDDVVTSGDGLYKDEYEDRYFFRGKNVNNYITFNNERAGWRILSIESDGTVKIMRNVSIGNMMWSDLDDATSWSQSSIQTYLNDTYYNNLTSIAQSQIVANSFSVGSIGPNNRDLAKQINNENKQVWYGKIGLITVSEYIRANSNLNDCGTINAVNNQYNDVDCFKLNWITNEGINYNDGSTFWSITRANDYGYPMSISYFPSTSGNIYGGIPNDYEKNQVLPTVYLSSEVKITGGDGSQSNPYTIQ